MQKDQYVRWSTQTAFPYHTGTWPTALSRQAETSTETVTKPWQQKIWPEAAWNEKATSSLVASTEMMEDSAWQKQRSSAE